MGPATFPSDELHACYTDSQQNGTVQLESDQWVPGRRDHHGDWLQMQFARADIDADGYLTAPECTRLLKQLNVHSPKKVVNQIFEANRKGRRERKNGENVLQMPTIISRFNSLMRRPEICQFFSRFKAKDSELMGPKELQRFLATVQREEYDVETCRKMILATVGASSKPFQYWSVGDNLTLRGFEAFLLSDMQDIFDYRHLSVCQDMTRPLNDYFIASSHNTYLLNHQLVGPSSVDGYINALRKGCRCLELDVWDGLEDSSGPVVFHGYTLTTKIFLKDVIETIKDHAFVASPYPVILSIENHCRLENQIIMAKYFREILGEQLCIDPVTDDMTQLPSPEQLKYKILIKAKKILPAGELNFRRALRDRSNIDDRSITTCDRGMQAMTFEVGSDARAMEQGPPAAPSSIFGLVQDWARRLPRRRSLDSLYDYAPSFRNAAIQLQDGECLTTAGGLEQKLSAENSRAAVRKVMPKRSRTFASSSLRASDCFEAASRNDRSGQVGEAIRRSLQLRRPLASSSSATCVATAPSISNQKETSPQELPVLQEDQAIAPELSEVINYTVATTFKDFSDAEKWHFNQMASFNESKCLRFLSNEDDTRAFVEFARKRIARVYPKGTRTSSTNYDPIPLFNVGCQMVALNYQTADRNMFYYLAAFAQNGGCGYVLKPSILRQSNFDVLRPPEELKRNLTVQIISGQCLPKPEEPAFESDAIDPYVVVKVFGHPRDNHVRQTDFVKCNGFNPSWNETFEFEVNVPELAYLSFVVKHDSPTGRNARLGEYTIPLSVMRPGYRHVHLRNGAFERITPSTLFVYVSLD